MSCFTCGTGQLPRRAFAVLGAFLVFMLLATPLAAQSIDIDPSSLSATLMTGQSELQELTIANQGTGILGWLLNDGEIDWLDRDDAISLASGENLTLSAVIDPAGKYAYFGTYTSPGRVVKFDLETFQRVDSITLASGENNLWSAVIDPAGKSAYFGTDTSPGRVVQIDLETFERADSISLGSGEINLLSAVIDPAGKYAYFGTDTSPGRVVQIDLETFQRVDSITLLGGEDNLTSAVIDPAGEYAYYGTWTSPGRVVKIDLETFQRVDLITLAGGENGLDAAVIDPAGKHAYFGTWASPGQVVKIDLETFQRIDAITLAGGENILYSAVIDPTGKYAYFGTQTSPGQVVKIDLETFQRVDSITLASGESNLLSAVIDPAGKSAYFGTAASPGQVVKMSLTRDCTPPGWLSADPQNGAVTGGTDQIVDVLMDATGLSVDDYQAELCINSNDPAQAWSFVPVELNVTPGPSVTASVIAGNGTITPPQQNVVYDASASWTVTPDTGWHTLSVTGDTCTPQDQGGGQWIAENITVDCAVEASFAIDVHTVTAAVASGNGNIDPPVQMIAHGDTAQWTLIPDTGWHTLSVTGDTCTPQDQGGGQWIAENITVDCAVEASFAIDVHTVTAAVLSGNGSIDPPAQMIDHGDAAQWTLTPGTGWHTLSVTGDTCTPQDQGGGQWVAENITVDCVVEASFGIDVHTVTAAVLSGNGSIDPLVQMIAHGDAAQWTVTADPGWHTLSVTGDTCTPQDQGGGQWTADNITEDCAVEASFEIDVYTVTAAVVSGNGSIDPPVQMIEHGDAAQWTVTPDTGWHTLSVTGDTCTPQDQGGGQWVADNITEDCAVEASFELDSPIGNEVFRDRFESSER